MNTWQLVKYGLALTADGYRQLAFIKSFLKPVVNKHADRLGYELSPSEKKKVLFYYPMYTVLACAQMYVCIKGRRLTRNETQRLTLVGAMATLCDDLIDEDQFTRDEIFYLLSAKQDEERLSLKAKLLIALNDELKSFWPLKQEYLEQLKTALEWQAISERQLNPSITLEEIVHICRNKNGHTSLMFATLVDEDWTEQERKFIFQSAMVGQLTNDSFDIYFDTQAGIKTYFNTAPTVGQVKEFFLHECKTLHELVLSTTNKPIDKLNTIRRMSVLHGFTLTAIDHLQETENKYGASTDWKIVARKDMVTDMWQNKNRFKTLRHIKTLSELY
jgi:hypothetical protein